MAFLTRVAVLAGVCELHDIAFTHNKIKPKDKELIEQVEYAVSLGKIDANLKENFKKFTTKEFSILTKNSSIDRSYMWQCKEAIEYEPKLDMIGNISAKEAGDAAKILKGFDFDKFAAWVKEKGYNESVVNTTKIFLTSFYNTFVYFDALYSLRSKVNALGTEGEVVKKEKIEIAAPPSKYFSSFDFLKYYTPKMQQAIVDAIPEIDAALDAGETLSSLVRRWDSIFNKHDKVKSFLGESLYNLHLRPTGVNEVRKADPKKLAIVNKDFAPVQDVFDKISQLETPSAKEREKRETIKRDWSPGADLLQKRLHEIIASVIEEWKNKYAEKYEAKLKNEWDDLVAKKISSLDDYRKWREEQEPKERRFIPWKPDQLLLTDKNLVVKPYPKASVSEEAKTLAESEGKLVATNFVSKNMGKLSSLLKKKKIDDIKVFGLQVSYPSIESSMYFKFEDESSFKVRNQFVQVMNQHGTVFWRYPTTFHDVRVSGKPMSQPSEYKVYMEFSGDAPPKEETQTNASFGQQVKSKYMVKK